MSNNAKNLPEVKLGQYKGLAVTRHVRPLSEKTIDQEMVHQTICKFSDRYGNSTCTKVVTFLDQTADFFSSE